MIILENDLKIKYKKCKNENFIEIASFEGPETTSYERSMGYETEYTWN
jgi:hypothetical protein